MANIREAFQYASQNPNSDFANNLKTLASSGALDIEAQSNGIDLSPFKQKIEQPKKTGLIGAAESVADFTGGKEIAQGLGQAIAQPRNARLMEESLNSSMDTQGKLLKVIKEKKALGQDTSRLEKALTNLDVNISQIGNQTEKVLNPNQLTNKQVVGDALQLATTAGGAKVAGAVAGKATQAVGVGKGIIQGAKTGAIAGTPLGVLTGASQGLQDDKDTKGILKDTLTGAVLGGLTGGLLGGATGGISGGVKANKIAKENKYLEAVTPDTKDLTPTEYEKLLGRGKITPKTSTQPSQYILSDEEKQIALKYKNLFTNDPVKNTENIVNEIAKKDKEVGNFLKKNNGIFNKGELKNYLAEKLKNIDDLTVDEKRLIKLKQSTIDNFIKGLGKNDMETLWINRKTFDKTIEKAFSGSPTLQNEIKKEFRNGVQDFIADRTPEGVYKSAMKEMTQLFNLKDITTTKAVKEKGLNAIQLWIKKNPTKAKALGWTAGTGIVGTLGASILKD